MRKRPVPGHLLAEDDPRVVAARDAMECIIQAERSTDTLGGEAQKWDLRDVAELVNAVLDADDEMAKGEDEASYPCGWCCDE